VTVGGTHQITEHWRAVGHSRGFHNLAASAVDLGLEVFQPRLGFDPFNSLIVQLLKRGIALCLGGGAFALGFLPCLLDLFDLFFEGGNLGVAGTELVDAGALVLVVPPRLFDLGDGDRDGS